MKTLKFDLKGKGERERKEVYEKARETLEKGGLVIFPTETVYGLGALATDEQAVRRIFAAKGRPSDNPLIVHVGDKQIDKYVREIPEIGRKLIEKYWPGPLTVIFKKSKLIPEATSAGLDTVGLRMPENEVAAEMLRYIDMPVAAPSANISGRPSPTTFKRCVEDMNGKVDVIIGADNSEIGLESTIVDVTVNPVEILRPGAITISQIREIAPDAVFRGNKSLQEGENPRAPGMKYTHYSPKADVTVLSLKNKEYKRLTEIVTKDSLLIYFGELKELTDFIESEKGSILGKVLHYKDEVEGSKEIFEALRQADDEEIKKIYIVETEDQGIGIALMNRVIKASGFKIIVI